MTIFEELGLHFAKHAHVSSVKTGTVTIGRETYPAARYVEYLETPTGTPAYARGERAYTREMIYCVGNLPSAKVRGNVAFTIAGDTRDWYVAGYYGNVTARKQEIKGPNEFHPFGNSFMLAPWDIADSKIDTYARTPYKRVPATLGAHWTTRKESSESAE